MKVKLTRTLPIAEKHGAIIGREFELVRRADAKAFFISDADVEIPAFRGEYILIREPKENES